MDLDYVHQDINVAKIPKEIRFAYEKTINVVLQEVTAKGTNAAKISKDDRFGFTITSTVLPAAVIVTMGLNVAVCNSLKWCASILPLMLPVISRHIFTKIKRKI